MSAEARHAAPSPPPPPCRRRSTASDIQIGDAQLFLLPQARRISPPGRFATLLLFTISPTVTQAMMKRHY